MDSAASGTKHCKRHLLLSLLRNLLRISRLRQIPRVELAEMGPALDMALRRHRAAAADLEKEALKQPKLTKKKARAVNTVLSFSLALHCFRRRHLQSSSLRVPAGVC